MHDRLLDSDAIIPGDVVYDRATFKPLQVVRLRSDTAENVDGVWGNQVNHVYYGIEPDSRVADVVFLPKGERITVPTSVHQFPLERLQRVPTALPTEDYRPQAIVVRAMFAHAYAQMRANHAADAAGELLTAVSELVSDRFADEVEELGDAIALA